MISIEVNNKYIRAQVEENQGHYHNYLAVSDLHLSEDDAREIQKRLGFHADGYGFYSFSCVLTETLGKKRWMSSWKSAVHCD